MKLFVITLILIIYFREADAQIPDSLVVCDCARVMPEKIYDFKTLGSSTLSQGLLVKCRGVCFDHFYIQKKNGQWLEYMLLANKDLFVETHVGYIHITVNRKTTYHFNYDKGTFIVCGQKIEGHFCE